MKLGALFGWGIGIYAVMFTLWSLQTLYGVGGVFGRGITLLALVLVATIAGRSLHLRRALDIIPYSIFWMVEVAVLDGLFSMPFSGFFAVYSEPSVLIGYALVALVPIFSPFTRTFGKGGGV